MALPIVNSDHSPIIFKPKPSQTSGTSFKYEAFWEEHGECREVVAASWEDFEVNSNPLVVLDSKVKNCKNNLMQWNLKTFKNAAKDINKLKTELQQHLNQFGYCQANQN